jgi:hypothetical protein
MPAVQLVSSHLLDHIQLHVTNARISLDNHHLHITWTSPYHLISYCLLCYVIWFGVIQRERNRLPLWSPRKLVLSLSSSLHGIHCYTWQRILVYVTKCGTKPSEPKHEQGSALNSMMQEYGLILSLLFRLSKMRCLYNGNEFFVYDFLWIKGFNRC